MNVQNKLSIWQRLVAPSPKLFALISKLAMIAGAIAFAVANFNTQMTTLGVVVPVFLVKVATIAQWVSAGALAISNLTVDFDKYKKDNALTP